MSAFHFTITFSHSEVNFLQLRPDHLINSLIAEHIPNYTSIRTFKCSYWSQESPEYSSHSWDVVQAELKISVAYYASHLCFVLSLQYFLLSGWRWWLCTTKATILCLTSAITTVFSILPCNKTPIIFRCFSVKLESTLRKPSSNQLLTLLVKQTMLSKIALKNICARENVHVISEGCRHCKDGMMQQSQDFQIAMFTFLMAGTLVFTNAIRIWLGIMWRPQTKQSPPVP